MWLLNIYFELHATYFLRCEPYFRSFSINPEGGGSALSQFASAVKIQRRRRRSTLRKVVKQLRQRLFGWRAGGRGLFDA